MTSLLLHWLLNAAALWTAAWLLPGLDFRGSLGKLLLEDPELVFEKIQVLHLL